MVDFQVIGVVSNVGSRLPAAAILPVRPGVTKRIPDRGKVAERFLRFVDTSAAGTEGGFGSVLADHRTRRQYQDQHLFGSN